MPISTTPPSQIIAIHVSNAIFHLTLPQLLSDAPNNLLVALGHPSPTSSITCSAPPSPSSSFASFSISEDSDEGQGGKEIYLFTRADVFELIFDHMRGYPIFPLTGFGGEGEQEKIMRYLEKDAEELRLAGLLKLIEKEKGKIKKSQTQVLSVADTARTLELDLRSLELAWAKEKHTKDTQLGFLYDQSDKAVRQLGLLDKKFYQGKISHGDYWNGHRKWMKTFDGATERAKKVAGVV